MEQHKPLVSVIIPVYNAAKSLARCIESVRKQTYENLEILLVNDGSTDACAAICQMYKRVDKRVQVTNKPHSGVSATRNCAIAAAQGEFIQFVDSDDYMSPHTTAVMVNAAIKKESDLVICAYYRVADEESKEITIDFSKRTDVMSQAEFARELLDEPASFYYGVLWNKLYRTDILHEHNILCHEDLHWCEDFLFNLEYIRYASRFIALQTPLYYYLQNKTSIVHTQINLASIIKTKAMLFPYYKELYKSIGLYEEYKPMIYKYLFASADDK